MTSKYSPDEASRGAERQASGWIEALDALERSLGEATRAVAMLRSLAQSRPAVKPASNVRELPLQPRPVEPREEAPEEKAEPNGEATDAFERVWARLEAEKLTKSAPEEPAGSDSPQALPNVESKLASLPGSYLITVEDRESRVDLVPLHRALASLPGAEEVTLVSFANGVPAVSLRTAGDLDFETLSKSVGRAMDRECEVIPHDSSRLFLRLTPRREEAS